MFHMKQKIIEVLFKSFRVYRYYALSSRSKIFHKIIFFDIFDFKTVSGLEKSRKKVQMFQLRF